MFFKKMIVFILVFSLIMLGKDGGIFAGRKVPVYYQNKAIVLTYHEIDKSKKSSATITPALFEEQVQMLVNEGYNVISMDQFTSFILKKQPIPDNAVLLTFDDGYESFYSEVYPMLQKYKFTATNFIIGKSSDIQMSNHLTWDQMREMKEAGFSFYSHTYTSHYHVQDDKGNSFPAVTQAAYKTKQKRMETKAEYENRLRKDIKLMEERLDEELGDQINLLCFPFGAYNATALKIGREEGIQLFFTTNSGINESGKEEILRVNAGSPSVTAKGLLEKLKEVNQPTVTIAPKSIKLIKLEKNH